jgi:RNA polymerase sigma-70 factor (ECF subfamily)
VGHAEKVPAWLSTQGEDGTTSMTTRKPDLSSTCTDAELAAALIAADPSASAIAWRRFVPLVSRMARRALGSGEEVEDIVQDVFSTLFRAIHRLREPEALRAFVITVTKRVLGHELRKRRLRAHLSADLGLQLGDTIGYRGDPATHHAYIHFRLLLGRLKERERRAFILRFVACMDAPEVAHTLGVSVPTARRAFSRAQSRLTLWAGRHAFLSDYLVADGPSELPPEAAAGTAA